MSRFPESLPWQSNRTLQLWEYGAGHSQLCLRSISEDNENDLIDVEFADVKRIELDTLYVAPVVFRAVQQHGSYQSSPRFPSLLIEVSCSGKEGFVAAGAIQITRKSLQEENLEILLME